MYLIRVCTCPILLLALLTTGCISGSVKAPVSSRDHVLESEKPARPATPPRKKQQGDFYVVQRGDTLYSIAWQYGLDYPLVASWNGLRPPYTIYSGQRLRMKPPPVKTTARKGTTARYTPRPNAGKPAPQAVIKKKPVSAPKSVKPEKPATPVKTAKTTKTSKTTKTAKSARTPGPASSAGWQWPAEGPILRGFDSSGDGKQGIDIGGRSGQSVRAANSGKVVYAGSGLVGYGRLIIIKHNKNMLSAYGHNQSLLVKEGNSVQAGQVIAEMGSSGTYRTQLYFEIRKDGKPVDPVNYLPKR